MLNVLGGSISNLYAFLSARHSMFPGYKEKGLHFIKGQLVMFTSCEVNNPHFCTTFLLVIILRINIFLYFRQSHYSVKSCASVCGLGTDHCIEVPADSR